jgi:hypothetical protein
MQGATSSSGERSAGAAAHTRTHSGAGSKRRLADRTQVSGPPASSWAHTAITGMSPAVLAGISLQWHCNGKGVFVGPVGPCRAAVPETSYSAVLCAAQDDTNSTQSKLQRTSHERSRDAAPEAQLLDGPLDDPDPGVEPAPTAVEADIYGDWDDDDIQI